MIFSLLDREQAIPSLKYVRNVRRTKDSGDTTVHKRADLFLQRGEAIASELTGEVRNRSQSQFEGFEEQNSDFKDLANVSRVPV
jgi:hypothetical protein